MVILMTTISWFAISCIVLFAINSFRWGRRWLGLTAAALISLLYLLLFGFISSKLYAQTWTSLHEMPYKTNHFIMLADSAKFSGGSLSNYTNGAEMTSGWWDTENNTEAPTSLEYGLGPETNAAVGNEGFWY